MTRNRPRRRLSGTPDYACRLAAALPATGAGDDDGPAETQIANWLARLNQFEGVPFTYLVPDPAMLPAESLRFFIVDDNWVAVLVDGALSIGAAAVGTAVGRTPEATAAFRARARGRMLHQRAAKLAMPVETLQAVTPAPAGNGVMSGFLLRSNVLNVWPQLEVKGFTDVAGTQPAALLRFDIMAPGLGFGLFSGLVQLVSFAEPSETVHFGIDLGTDANPAPGTKSLRYADAVDTNAVGEQVLANGGSATVPVPFRPGGRNVVDISALAQGILTGLQANDAIAPSPDTVYTAARFGLELVEGVQEIEYTIRAAAPTSEGAS